MTTADTTLNDDATRLVPDPAVSDGAARPVDGDGQRAEADGQTADDDGQIVEGDGLTGDTAANAAGEYTVTSVTETSTAS